MNKATKTGFFSFSFIFSWKIPKSFGAQGKTGLFLETPEDPTLNRIPTPMPNIGLSAFRPLAASLPGCSRLNTPSELVAHTSCTLGNMKVNEVIHAWAVTQAHPPLCQTPLFSDIRII